VRFFDEEQEPSPFLKALEEVRRMATREGWRYQHVQAIIVAIDQFAEAATGKPRFLFEQAARCEARCCAVIAGCVIGNLIETKYLASCWDAALSALVTLT